jgi:acyl carrier protein
MPDENQPEKPLHPMHTPTLISEVLAVLRESVPPDVKVDETCSNTVLLDLGIDSMRLISIIVELEGRIGLDFNKVIDLEPPRTVQDLFNLAAKGCREPSLSTGEQK